MDRVRQPVLESTVRASQGLIGVDDSAVATGFSSRSHFTRRYQEQYGEQPQDTLTNGLQAAT